MNSIPCTPDLEYYLMSEDEQNRFYHTISEADVNAQHK